MFKNEKIKKILKRLKKKVVWTSMISLFLIIFNQFDMWDIIGITEDKFKVLTDTILGILVVLGILNNPED